MLDRREFLGAMSLPVAASALGLGMALPRPGRAAEIARDLAAHPGEPDDVARDEDSWAQVGRAFTVDRSLVNLNNSGVSPLPAFAQDAMRRHLEYSNGCPAHALSRSTGSTRRSSPSGSGSSTASWSSRSCTTSSAGSA